MGAAMISTTSFDYDRFVTLGGVELCHYVEALLADPTMKVSSQSLDRMLSDLPDYDEYHTVYALTLGVAHSPKAFVPHVVQYLGHEQSSVCCTAFNILKRLPDEFVTQELVESVQKVPVDRKLYTDRFDGTRHLVGTNTPLVSEVLAELKRRLEKGRDS
jgi:hypothetical protein